MNQKMAILICIVFIAGAYATSEVIRENPAIVCSNPYEEYKSCGLLQRCVPSCKNPNGLPCPKVCGKGCYCIEGYVRDENLKCIPKDECPKPICKKNEEWVECPCEASCERPEYRTESECKETCRPGCACKHGFVRDIDGYCVEPNECLEPICKKRREIFTYCGTACPLTCKKPTVEMCTEQCVTGCFCEDGYYRDKHGNCVRPSKCNPPFCKEKYERFTHCSGLKGCQATCELPYGKECNDMCVFGCKCEDGYVRDANWKCIRKSRCPKPECKKNEEWSSCGDTPCAATCKNIYLPFMCKGACRPGCGCKHGYVRDDNGDCIRPKECPEPVCPVENNEVYTGCSGIKECQPTCAFPEGKNCEGDCVMGCKCKKGYIRDDHNNVLLSKCIPEEECPKTTCEKDNEEWSDCGVTICEATCSDPDKPLHCKAQCSPGCGCKPGYVRDDKGNCIRYKYCPQNCKKKHEVYTECGPTDDCEIRCDRPTGGFACPKDCVKGCFCEAGYVRDSEGYCILKEDCPKPECPRHEEWSDCGAHGCLANCEHPDLPTVCDPAPGCYPGCICEKGYIRNNDGKCVRPEQCPKKLACGENEDYHKCTALCFEKTCAKREDRYCGLGCQEKCLCKEGYVRDENKQCIRVEECPKPVCKKSHEYYTECGTACPLSCDRPYVEACTLQCVAGCFCEEGYIRDKDGDCIRPNECYPSICKKKHERFTHCSGNKDCQATCEFPDGRGCDKRCIFGCKCEDGYVRDANWNCIRKSKCPKPECPNHEVYSECGAHGCQDTCDNPTRSHVCRAICTPGCICEEGYIRNANGKCVLPTQCNECPSHEVWTDCNFFCGNKYCDFLINPVACKPAGCTSGCICEDGYYRDANEVCVPENSCPV